MASPYFVGRTAYFGTLIPNTFAAQARESFFEMQRLNAGYYGRSGALLAGMVVLYFVAMLGGPRTPGRVALLALAGALAAVSMRVFNWMPGARLFQAPIALTLVAATPVVAGLRGRGRAAATLALGLWLAWLAVGPPRAEELDSDARNTALPGNEAERMARAIAADAPPGSWLLSRDAGLVPYFVGPDVSVIDIHPYSLTDPALTGRPFDVDHVLEHRPRYLVTTSTVKAIPTVYPEERTLLTDPRVEGHFRRIGVAFQHERRWYTLWTTGGPIGTWSG